MVVWSVLLLLLGLGACFVPDPLSVSIESFNMEHMVHFVPGPGTPDSARFTVQTLRTRAKSIWSPVSQCATIKVGQGCNVTLTFKHLDLMYRARVQAFSSEHRSNWTESGLFQPLTDTVLGPPNLHVSGCGNCLLLRVTPPQLKTEEPLELFRDLRVIVRRSPDGVQFNLSLALTDENRIDHLQRGVEYCVTVSLPSIYNHNNIPSSEQCALSSPLSPDSYSVVWALAALVASLCALLILLGCLLFFSSLPDSRTRCCSSQI